MAANILEEKKGQDVLILDITSAAVFSDYFVIATGISPIHVQALADEVEKKLLKKVIYLEVKKATKTAMDFDGFL
jgi:ribosome-associated protein